MKRLFVVGLGPGGRDGMTLEAKKALEQSEVICGYTAYADLIREDYPEKEYLVSGMTKEVERCHMALLAAQDGKTTAMICSGDAGVYGMAGLVLSLAEKYPETEVVIVAGVTAALSGAARLGAQGHGPAGGIVVVAHRPGGANIPAVVVGEHRACPGGVPVVLGQGVPLGDGGRLRVSGGIPGRAFRPGAGGQQQEQRKKAWYEAFHWIVPPQLNDDFRPPITLYMQ